MLPDSLRKMPMSRSLLQLGGGLDCERVGPEGDKGPSVVAWNQLWNGCFLRYICCVVKEIGFAGWCDVCRFPLSLSLFPYICLTSYLWGRETLEACKQAGWPSNRWVVSPWSIILLLEACREDRLRAQNQLRFKMERPHHAISICFLQYRWKKIS